MSIEHWAEDAGISVLRREIVRLIRCTPLEFLNSSVCRRNTCWTRSIASIITPMLPCANICLNAAWTVSDERLCFSISTSFSIMKGSVKEKGTTPPPVPPSPSPLAPGETSPAPESIPRTAPSMLPCIAISVWKTFNRGVADTISRSLSTCAFIFATSSSTLPATTPNDMLLSSAASCARFCSKSSSEGRPARPVRDSSR
mmetsp:Transcript_34422/g.65780  ORF Transcript_34422/g.65780 Transcript_34422/m.65780 type:complete len:200 (-) Transcript_34422:1995-2594(-)